MNTKIIVSDRMGNFFTTPYLPDESPVSTRPSTPAPPEDPCEGLTVSLPVPETLVIHSLTLSDDRTKREATIDHSPLPLSLLRDESGILLYTLSVTEQRVCFFVPTLFRAVECRRDQIALEGLEKGELYHIRALTRHFLGEVSSLSVLTRRKYTERSAFACDDVASYRQLILPGLLLGCRVRDYEQRCATVVQMGELRLSMPPQKGWLLRLKLKTAGGDSFVVDVTKVKKDVDDKKWIVICSESKDLPSSVRQGCHLEIIEEEGEERNWQSPVTGALHAFYSHKKAAARSIDNWPLLERTYGSPNKYVLARAPRVDYSIRLRNGRTIKLNTQQSEAIARYNSSSTLAFAIEAPPGSGKTMTAAAMAISYSGKGVQLFLSTANIPVNNMALSLAKLDCGNRRPIHLMSSEGEERTHDQIKSPFSPESLAMNQEALRQKIEQLEKMEIAPGKYAAEERKLQKTAIWRVCETVLNDDHDIFFSTIDTILKRLTKPNKSGYHNEDTVKRQLESDVERIVVDEASQMNEAALNALIINFPKAQIVLIGDSKQLEPFRWRAGDVISQLAYRSALTVMKEKMNVPVIRLQEVYRASESLMAHYSDVFYDGKLKSKRRESENLLSCFGGKAGDRRCLFWKVNYGRCQLEGTSKINKREIRVLYHIIKTLRNANIYEDDVMIISYYEAQRKKAAKMLKEYWKGYEVLTVDSAQVSTLLIYFC